MEEKEEHGVTVKGEEHRVIMEEEEHGVIVEEEEGEWEQLYLEGLF